MAKLAIDFSRVEASTGARPALPTGWQRMIIEESEHKPTSNNATTGNELISIKLKVLDGPYMNAVLFKTFNYKNQNEQAQTIGWGEMKALNDALGIAQPEDTQEWHNKPLLVHIKYKAARTIPATETSPAKDYDEGNDINGFKSINDTTVSVNHNVVTKSAGQNVVVSPDFATGGSPVPQVGVQFNPAAPVFAAAVAQTVIPATPAAPVAPVIPAQPAAPVYQMTAKANGMTREQFVAADPAWTAEVLIANGYMEEVKPAVVMPAAPSAPAAPAVGGAAVPPWLQGKQ